MLVILIKVYIPPDWKTLFGEVSLDNQTMRLHIVHQCLEGRMTVKNWYYNWLCLSKYKINNSAMVKWMVDLNVLGIPDKWPEICRKLLSIRNPKLQDFGRSFLHRSYHLNSYITTYRPGVSVNCTFCQEVEETVLHLYWECRYTKALWSKVKTFVFENISEEVVMSPYSCVLSDFECHGLVLLSVIVKYRIFLMRLNNWKLSYVQVLKDLRWQQDTHLDGMNVDNLTPYYQFWGTLISDNLFETEYVRYPE